MQIRTLSTLECTSLLTTTRLARIACTKDGRPYVVPIHFAYADNHLYAFSMPGKKIDWMRANPLVSVVVEEPGQAREWKSVVVDGRFEELPDRIGHKVERDHAWALLSKYANWWEPGALKPVTPPVSDHSDHLFYRIIIDSVSGREARD
jgi:nitroimidazol reductase NimA-like FMN-containing flavoprotein (pyridoxamine 5'-phosphate oxidase superfamily)